MAEPPILWLDFDIFELLAHEKRDPPNQPVPIVEIKLFAKFQPQLGSFQHDPVVWPKNKEVPGGVCCALVVRGGR